MGKHWMWAFAAWVCASAASGAAAWGAVANSLVLNEASMVSGEKFLDQLRTSGTPRNRSDLSFGRLQGNGQNWMEFLIVQGDDLGGGAFANTLDLRGWKINWSYDKNDPTDPNKKGSGTIEFTNDPLWAAIPKGTLLTMNEWKEAWYHDAGIDHNEPNKPVYNYHGLQRDGGINGLGEQKGDPEAMFQADPSYKKVSFATDTQWNPLSSGSDGVSAGQTGDWRIHVWAGERTPDQLSYKYFNFSGTVYDGDLDQPIDIGTPDGGLFALNNDNWEWSIVEPVDGGPDNVIQGPIGEALTGGFIGVSSDELYRLENFPISRTPPATQANYLNVNIADYVDGTSSAFGKPNVWSSGSETQNLAPLRNWLRQGDVNLDGQVDGDDLLAIQRGVGSVRPSLTDGDLDGNGVINGADLAVWKTKFGVAAIAAGAAVPEASTSMLTASLLAAACGCRRVRWRYERGSSASHVQ